MLPRRALECEDLTFERKSCRLCSYAATDGGVVAKSHASDHAVECRNARSELFNNRCNVAVIVLRSCGPIETRTCCGLKIWCCDDYCFAC